MTTSLGGISYLDAIRPDPGWEVDLALVTSYSSDMVVLVAVVLALAGLDDERGSGSKVDFASAHERLRDRVKFLVQAGRISMPKTNPCVLGIMDRFVCCVRTDERLRSWHPKVSLIRYTQSESQRVQWRFWIGSRNLTNDCSWDLGVVLVGQTSQNGAQIPGIAELGEVLTGLSGLSKMTPNAVRRELSGLSWDSPAGITVRRVELRQEGGGTGLPKPPEEMEELLVISPFIDGSTIQILGAWGNPGVKRLLLSSRFELAKLLGQKQLPTSGFEQLLFMDAPDTEDDGSGDVTAKQDEAEKLLRGLHAKLICAKGRGAARIWMGSANATVRGWVGGNSEAIAEMDIDEKVYVQLREFVESGTVLECDEAIQESKDFQEELIEEARKVISASWAARLEVVEGVPVLVNPVPFNPDIPGVDLQIGLITSQAVDCLRGVTSLKLPAIAPFQLTELVAVRLSSGEVQAAWVEKAECVHPLSLDRDQRALAHFLTPRVFLEWIRSLLHSEFTDDGGGDWAEASTPHGGKGISSHASSPWWAPSLEEVLRAWSKNPNSLLEVDRRLKGYMKYMEEHHKETGDLEDLNVLLEFAGMWETVRRELVRNSCHG